MIGLNYWVMNFNDILFMIYYIPRPRPNKGFSLMHHERGVLYINVTDIYN